MTDPTRQFKRRQYDAKRRNEQEIRRLYKSKRWLRIRAETLARDSSCVMHKRDLGEIVPSSHCDHVVPHRGDVVKFWKGPFQGLCAACHNGRKQQEELEGFSRQMGEDGFPLDDNHPWGKS